MSDTSSGDPNSRQVAYFSMEIGLDASMPTYAGGLGVLAGDTVRAAADIEIPMIAVTLIHRKGYFRQHVDELGVQTESAADWDPESCLEELRPRIQLTLEGATVHVRAWRYIVRGVTGFDVPVYLLDTDLGENHQDHRGLTDVLYGGDHRYRLCQETVLGLGGLWMLRALGHTEVQSFHLNEGHSALLTLGLFEETHQTGVEAVDAVRERCVFTTHTPVAAGHDRFPVELARRVLGSTRTDQLMARGCCPEQQLNLTYVALFFSRYVNGVAMRHGQVSRGLFPGYPIASITNGVHAATWVAEPFQTLYDRHIPEWRQQNDNLRYAVGVPLDDVIAAHQQCKDTLVREVFRRSGTQLRADVMTLGFARRATPYKRADLLVSDMDRLREISRVGPIQIIYAGKAHPHDRGGKEIIRQIVERAAQVSDTVTIVFLEEYDMALAGILCAGVDLWINTPKRPQEASGTSGMKAALNGVPSLSVLDGWWIEGHVEGVTGWSIGDGWEPESDPMLDARALYRKLEQIVPLFYRRPEAYAQVQRHAIGLNGSFFNAQRMLEQYRQTAYRPTRRPAESATASATPE